ncbi:MAG: T9SS type A sorting domain-containing protein [Bacteroidetes bacterium]|nr:T9SS type A sorting domain-containing protein [Bacteroidota bacterium]MBL0065635.1 T9SS type A sorting domain-containing protein [Bacteroidota bacterium]
MKKITILFLTISLIVSRSNGQWINTGGPYGGSGVLCIALTDSLVFAGTGGDGIFRSADNGMSWTAVNTGLDDLAIRALAFDGINLYAGTNSYGVYFSSDFGTSWSPDTTGMGLAGIYSLSVVDSTIFAGTTGNTIYKAHTGGGGWTIDTLDYTVFLWASLIKNQQVLYTTSDPIHYTANAGVSWDTIARPPSMTASLVVLDSKLIVGTLDGIYVSEDTGRTWYSSGLSGIFIPSLYMSGSYLYAGTNGDGLYSSPDTGTTWIHNTAAGAYIWNISGIDSSVLVCSGGGNANGRLLRSTDNGNTWQTIGVEKKSVIRKMINHGADIYASAKGIGMVRSSDNGDHWLEINTDLPIADDIISIYAEGNSIFAGTSTYGVYKSTNNGANWSAVNNNLPAGYITAFASSGSRIFTVDNNAIYFTTNQGASWFPFDASVISNYTSSINTLLVKDTNLFAGTTYTWVPSGGLFKSGITVPSWVISSAGLPTVVSISSLVAMGNSIFCSADSGASSYGGVFLSTDTGTSWIDVTNQISPPTIKTLLVVENNLFAGTDAGVYMSSDSGSSWTNINSGLPPGTIVSSLFSDSTYLYLGTGESQLSYQGEGVWRRPLSELGITTGLSNKLAMEIQVFPNPAHDQIHILTNGISTNTDLRIYNALGILVSREEMHDQNHIISLRKLPPGIYYLMISDPTNQLIKKIIIQ